MEVPVFIFTGFIDSGKTTLLRDTLESPDFKAYRNLIIVCEEGDEEYDEEFLKKNHAFAVYANSKEELKASYLKALNRQYEPDQVMIEYNGTWEMSVIMDCRLPAGWEINGVYSVADGSTAEGYLANMRQMYMEQFAASGLIIFNRCDEGFDRAKVRRLLKTFNPMAQLIFEKPDGEMYDPASEPLPYDLNADIIEIEDIDYGTWYADSLDRPENYYNKTLRFTAQLYRGVELEHGQIVPGRFIMTCCEADIRFMGHLCDYKGNMPFKQRDWVIVTVKFDYKYIPAYGQKAPLLHLIDIKPAEKPEIDPVFF